VAIRKEQMEALDFLGLEGHLREHLNRFARDHIKSISQDNLREFIRLGIRNANHFGWTKRGPVEFFLEVMVMLGSEFHTDPQYPWARTSLQTPRDEMIGADHLHAEMMKYYDAVLGPGLCYEAEAIERLLMSDNASRRHLQETGKSEIPGLLEWAFPQKYSFIGQRAVSALIDEGERTRLRLGIAKTGLALVTAALFSFGHGCFSDPQYPWILASVRIRSTDATGLYRILRRYLGVALVNMGKN